MSDHVKVNVTSDTSGLSAGLAHVQKSVDEFKEHTTEGFKEVGKEFAAMLAVGAVLEGLHSVMEEMDRVEKLSVRFGESAESIQRVGQAAKLSGSDMETVAKAMTKVNTNAITAIKGNEEMASSFETLGINAATFVDLPMEDKLTQLAAGYEEGETNALKLDAVMKILGKSGGELIPMLAEGRDGLKKMFADASVASAETVKSIAQNMDKMERVFMTIKVWGADAIGFLISSIEAVTEALSVFLTFLGNLPKGFKAATTEADRLAKSYHDLRKEAEEKEEHGKGAEKKTAEIEAEKQMREEAAKAAKESASDIAKLEAENEKKRQEAHERHITWAQHEHELKQKLIGLDKEAAFKGGGEKEKLERESRRLDIQKDLEKVQGDIKAYNAKQAEEDKKKAKETAKEKAKAELDAKKDVLKEAQDKLGELKKDKGFTVDSLRQIGGGVAGVNYNKALSKDDLARQAVTHQKETVEQLKKVVQKLEEGQKKYTSSNGSFELE